MRKSKHNNPQTTETCSRLYAQHRSLAKVSQISGIPLVSVSRILRRAGVEKNAPGDAHRGKQWSAARRAHHPAKPLRDPNEPSGYAILTARAMRRRVINKAGYVVVHVGKGRKQYEHKIVAERALGRVLRPGEVVHHINCDRSDNRPENLLVCKIAYHLKLHARMRAHPYWKQFNP